MAAMFKIINFLIFAGILVFILRKPLKKLFAGRKKEIENRIMSAGTSHESISREHTKLKNLLENLEKDKMTLVAELKKEGEIERGRIVNQANAYADRLVVDAKRGMENEVNKSAMSLRRLIVEEVMEIVRERLSKEITKKEQAAFSKAAVEELRKHEGL